MPYLEDPDLLEEYRRRLRLDPVDWGDFGGDPQLRDIQPEDQTEADFQAGLERGAGSEIDSAMIQGDQYPEEGEYASQYDSIAPQETAPPQAQKRPGFLSRLKQAAPDLIAAGLAAGATPNIAFGGPTDVLRAASIGMQGTALARRRRQMEDVEQQRQDVETAATLETRRRQSLAADAARERAQKQERYINAGGGVVFDRETGKYLDQKEASFARDFDRRRKEAVSLGLSPGTPEYTSYVGTGKLPEGYGKKEAPPPPPRPQATVEIDAALARKHGLAVPPGAPTVKVPEASYGRIVTAEQAERTAKNKPPPKAQGALTEQQRLARQDKQKETFGKIEKTKEDRMLKADEELADQKITQPAHSLRIKRIQAAYEAEIRANGGTVAPKSTSPAAAAAQPASVTYSEAEVRAAAVAKGRDPNAAVAAARAKGLIR